MKQMLLCLVLISTSSMFSMQGSRAYFAKKALKSYMVNCTPLSSMNRSEMNNEIVKVLKSAKESINVNMYSFTSVDLACALAFAKDVNNARIKVIIDRASTNGVYNIKRFLAQLGIDVQIYASTDGRMNHHKYAIVDGKRVILGSYNYSKAAAEYNLESAVILEGRPIASFYEKDFKYTQSEIAKQEDYVRSKNAKLAHEWSKKKRIHDEHVQQWKKSQGK